MRKKTITLYFTEESAITDAQQAEMEAFPGARQRNASLVDPESPLEKADFVAGPAIPEQYAKAYPHADTSPKRLPKSGKPEEEEEGDGADPEKMTVAQLTAALEGKAEIPKGAKKAELVALYLEHVS